MRRLLQGDVGSGKTLVAALAALQAIENGWQAALMAPTEILAEQHYLKLAHWLEPLGVKIAWLAGTLKGREKKKAIDAIAAGAIQLAIGTHALFQEGVEFAKLGLSIIDEQHRFGVEQRLALSERARGAMEPHQLMMSATPIPRTLSMTYYADLDVTVIDELPPGRTPVVTKLVAEERRDEVISRVRDSCRDGAQAYWVCPLIEESEALQLQTAIETFETIKQTFPDLAVGLVHGRLKPAEKAQVMADFKAKKIQLLVATTVIEVGVDVPNATLMVIEHAERMGLAQLHQLRGRVGRGSQQSLAILLYYQPLSEPARQRLKVIYESNDGFEIARADLALRGARGIPRRAPERRAAAALRRPREGHRSRGAGPRRGGAAHRGEVAGRGEAPRPLARHAPVLPQVMSPMLAAIRHRLDAYEKLVRLDKPIGILLLLWPTLWALWLARREIPPLLVLWIFVLGTVLMRSAGCAVNDFADRKFDAEVARTRERPLASGRIAPWEALVVGAVLALAAFALVVELNRLTVMLSFAAVAIAAIYPFTKRFFWMPQAWLGVAFGFGIPMAFAALTGEVPPLAWALLGANILWTISYDTEYAMVDRHDDLRIGIRTSAIVFGRHDVAAVMACYCLFLVAMAGIGLWQGYGPLYYVGLAAASAIAMYHYRLIAGRTREGCFRAFRHNNWLGLAVFAGIAADTWMMSR
jgi:4-hydroxybenzoate polyprenyl transferase